MKVKEAILSEVSHCLAFRFDKLKLLGIVNCEFEGTKVFRRNNAVKRIDLRWEVSLKVKMRQKVALSVDFLLAFFICICQSFIFQSV